MGTQFFLTAANVLNLCYSVNTTRTTARAIGVSRVNRCCRSSRLFLSSHSLYQTASQRTDREIFKNGEILREKVQLDTRGEEGRGHKIGSEGLEVPPALREIKKIGKTS